MNMLPRTGAHSRRHRRRRPPSLAPGPGPTRLVLARLSIRRPSVPRLTLRRLRGDRTGPRREATVESRRARALLAGAVVFAAIVLLSALPWSTLMNQHAQLASDSTQVGQLQAENRALTDEARELSQSSTMAGLAREDYGMVEPGQRAYEVLPASGATVPNAIAGGHVPLDEAPVVPGSARSEELLGAGVGAITTASAAARSAAASARGVTGVTAGGPPPPGSSKPGGFWSRVAHTLEFWN